MRKIMIQENVIRLGLILIILMSLIVFIYLGGCQCPDSTVKFLKEQGYTEIQITGWRPFMGEKDFYSTGFKAKNMNGKVVTGALTEGFIFKGKTIRFD